MALRMGFWAESRYEPLESISHFTFHGVICYEYLQIGGGLPLTHCGTRGYGYNMTLDLRVRCMWGEGDIRGFRAWLPPGVDSSFEFRLTILLIHTAQQFTYDVNRSVDTVMTQYKP